MLTAETSLADWPGTTVNAGRARGHSEPRRKAERCWHLGLNTRVWGLLPPARGGCVVCYLLRPQKMADHNRYHSITDKAAGFLYSLGPPARETAVMAIYHHGAERPFCFQ